MMTKKLDSLATTAVLVVDMINDYLAEDGAIPCKEALDIVPNINLLTDFVRSRGGHVVFSNTSLRSGDEPIARKWGMHALRGSKGEEVYEGLTVGPDDKISRKISYNAFFKTRLENTLRSMGVENLIVVGIHTHVCVLLTASAASDRGFHVIALEDCMTTGYRPNHDTRLRFFSTHIGELATLHEYLKAHGY